MVTQNYKDISLLSAPSKLFTKILDEEVLQTGLSEEQKGFRHNRSDSIFILRQLAKKSIEYNKPSFICFIDLTKAFDRVRLSDFLKLPKDRNLNLKTIEINRKMNIGDSTFIKENNKLNKEIPVSTGIRQRTVLAQYYLLY